jgi:hypothetical protein
MAWMWLSIVTLLLGAELNSEMERQTARDTTEGQPKPLGVREAYAADSVAEPGVVSHAGASRVADAISDQSCPQGPKGAVSGWHVPVSRDVD